MVQRYSIREYFQPETLREVSELVTLYPGEATLLAGGTDLLNKLPLEREKGIRIISLKKVQELRGIRENPDGEVFIGAMTCHADVADSPILRQHFPSLAKASGLVGSPSIRNLGTIGGNLANASPSADTAPPLLAYGAKATIWSPSGEKQILVEDFFTGPSANALKKGEILKGLLVKPKEDLKSAYQKLGMRKAQEIAIVNICISLAVEKMDQCSEIRIALGAVAPTPIRAKKAETLLRQKRITGERIREAAQAAMNEASPLSDIRASTEYRREMVGTLVEQMISELSNRNSRG
jgi:aerobic carbon-monoxide dehydrogenase medium subunit